MSRCESCAKVPLTMPSIVAATKVALPSMCLSVAALELETNILYGNNGCQWDQMEESIARRVERPASTYPWEMFFGSSSPCDVGIEKRGPKLISLPHVLSDSGSVDLDIHDVPAATIDNALCSRGPSFCLRLLYARTGTAILIIRIRINIG